MSLLREAERCLANQKTFAHLNAFITPLERSTSWREQLRDADARRERGESSSPVDGKLVAVKDNICTQQLPTTCASAFLQNYTSSFNATVVELLEKAGAVVAGKTNLDEFGMGSHSIHSHFGPVKNNRSDREDAVSAGGSSGGSAVAVSTGQCHVALGTDTGGSVRLPAAYTGILGFKPSYGLISRWGVVAYANSLDTVGIMGDGTSIIRQVFDVVNRYDRRDPTNISEHTRSRIIEAVRGTSKARNSGLRIGVPVEYNIEELSPSVQSAWKSSLSYLQSQGHTIHPVSLPTTKQALSAYYVLAPAEASSNLAKYDGVRYGTRDTKLPDSAGGYLYAGTREAGFGEEVRRRILLGTYSLSADKMDNYFIQAQKIRRLVQSDFNAVFELDNPLLASETNSENTKGDPKVDVIICPTAPSPPPTLSSLKHATAVGSYTNDVFTVPASLAGLPALSVPVAFPREVNDQATDVSSGTAGIQVIGQYGDDDLVLDVGAMLERM